MRQTRKRRLAARGLREGPNPARWRGYPDAALLKPTKFAKVQHHAAVPVGEVAAFMQRLRGQAGMGARALEFAVLTAARSGEVRGATWAELDLKAAVVFPGLHGPLSDISLTAVLRRMQVQATAHGFTSTFRDWSAEHTQHTREVAEMALAHAVGDMVEAAYRRGDLFDKRVQLLADWAAFIS